MKTELCHIKPPSLSHTIHHKLIKDSERWNPSSSSLCHIIIVRDSERWKHLHLPCVTSSLSETWRDGTYLHLPCLTSPSSSSSDTQRDGTHLHLPCLKTFSRNLPLYLMHIGGMSTSKSNNTMNNTQNKPFPLAQLLAIPK